MVELIHKKFIESRLKDVIKQKGAIYVGKNLNDYITYSDATKYWKSMKQKKTQLKASKDTELGRVVQEIIMYLLEHSFKLAKVPFFILEKEDLKKDEGKELKSILGIKRKGDEKVKSFDNDIILVNKNDYPKPKKIFILSCKGTIRERIGQFFSHLFLMDQKVMNIKYGNLYEVLFAKKDLQLKYALVTFDWAKQRDLDKFTKNGKLKKTIKEMEGFLISDDKTFGGGLYVLNNYEHLKSVKSFDELIKTITLFLK